MALELSEIMERTDEDEPMPAVLEYLAKLKYSFGIHWAMGRDRLHEEQPIAMHVKQYDVW